MTKLYITGYDIRKVNISGYQHILAEDFDLNSIKKLDIDTVILNAHGSLRKFLKKKEYNFVDKNTDYIHAVRIEKNFSYLTHTILEEIANSKPINAFILSCFSGTEARKLVQNLASGSAIITTSKEHMVSLVNLGDIIIQNMEQYSREISKNFAQIFLDNLPIFAASFAQFITSDYSFIIQPGLQVLTSRQYAGNFLDKQQQKFISEIDKNYELKNLYTQLELKKISDDEIDLFAKAYLAYVCYLREEDTIDFLVDNKDNDYLGFLVKSNLNDISVWHFVVAGGHVEIVKLLLTMEEIDINLADKYGVSLLMSAVNKGHIEIVKLLLAMGDIDVNQADKYGVSPLCYAVNKGYIEIVKLLLAMEDIDINQANKSGISPLCRAVNKGHIEIVKLLLTMEEIDINLADEDGLSSLCYAVNKGHIEIVKLLLIREDIDVNLADEDGLSPLCHAVNKGHIEIVKLLLAMEDIDINQANKYGMSPLYRAVNKGHIEIVKLLLTMEEIDINQVDKSGYSLLHRSVSQGYIEIVKLLLAMGEIDVNQVDKYGYSLLMSAVNKGHIEIVKLLLIRADIDVNLADEDGLSPLCHAVNKGHIEIVKLLLAMEGIDVNQVDKYGMSPLYRSVSQGYIEVTALLLKHEAEIDYNDSSWNSAIRLAGYENNSAILKLFVDNCLKKDSKIPGKEQCLVSLAQNEVFAAFITSMNIEVDVNMHAMGVEDITLVGNETLGFY